MSDTAPGFHMHGMHMPAEAWAVVLAASNRPYKEMGKATALRTSYPHGSNDFAPPPPQTRDKIEKSEELRVLRLL